MASAPSAPAASWERAASLVKNATTQIQYIEHIRNLHDPAQHVKTLEDEIRGTMGKALGKQADKIRMHLMLMQQERETYEKLWRALQEEQPNGKMRSELRQVAIRHNEFHEQAHHSRWELIVHRQAIGFIVRNHEVVYSTFPIGDKLPVEAEDDVQKDIYKKEKVITEKKFGSQLDWWQQIGRWR